MDQQQPLDLQPPPEPQPPPGGDLSGADLGIGVRVRLRSQPRYLKTADPMPMLRPPDLLEPGEAGTVVALRALDQRAVRFGRGTFLLAAADLMALDPPPELDSPPSV